MLDLVVVVVLDSVTGSESGSLKPGGRRLETSSNFTDKPPNSLSKGLTDFAASVVVVVVASVLEASGELLANPGGRRALMSSLITDLLARSRSKRESVLVSTVLVVDSDVDSVAPVDSVLVVVVLLGAFNMSNG